MVRSPLLATWVRKKGSFGKVSFQKSPFSRENAEFRDSSEPPGLWKTKKNPTIVQRF